MIINGKGGVIVSGVVSRDPEFKQIGSKGTNLLRIGVRYGAYENKKGKYIDVNVWGNYAIELSGLISKGDVIMACGELNQREHNGKTYYSVSSFGEVYPAIGVINGLISAIETPYAEPLHMANSIPTESSASDAFAPIEDTEDLPFY